MAINANFTGLGLNTDSLQSQIKEGQLTYALNSLVESFDGDRITYQNEASNELCIDFPDNLRPIGAYNITHIKRIVYFLTDGDKHEIGYSDNDNCEYKTLFSASCLNFSLKYPIHQVVIKITNCGVQVYWTDNLNQMRFFDFEDLPWTESPNPNNAYQPIKNVGTVDCNKLLVLPNYSVPEIEILSVEEGGSIKTGAYQFSTQYANIAGEGYSSFYNTTDSISINDSRKETEDFNLTTSKAIRVKVKSLDTTGLFDFFNLVVIETINGISTPKLVGTYPISNGEHTILYDGNTSEAINLTFEQLFQKYQYYEIADGVTATDDRIVWYNVKTKQRQNYQEIWSKVKLNWVSYKLPYNQQEGYNNPENTHLYKGYMRDEVYPFEGVFVLKNGKETDRFPLVNRLITTFDQDIIKNDDVTIDKDPCDPPSLGKPRWKVYNTASVTYSYPNTEDNCYKGKYQKGEFAYWESEAKYPNNPTIWGSLANQPIRHFKFPDELVSSRYSSDGTTHFIYPLGVEIDAASLREAIEQSNLSQEDKDQIQGFKIVRGDRSAGNQSIVAKGLMFNVGKTKHNEQEFYYPNYPFNDLRKDPYFVKDDSYNNGYKGIIPHSSYAPQYSIEGFGDHSKSRFTFHSPDTHFNQPFGVDSGYIKIESIEYGNSVGHFVNVQDNAEYKFLTGKITDASLGIAVASGFTLAAGTFGWPTMNVGAIAPAYVQAEEMWEKLAPFTNFGYAHHSTGSFDNTYKVPNDGFKIRPINYGKYITEGNHGVEDGALLNNQFRESSVYFNSLGDFKFAQDYSNTIPDDTSRYTLSSAFGAATINDFLTQQIGNGFANVSDDDISSALGIANIINSAPLYEFNTFSLPNGGLDPNPGDTYDAPTSSNTLDRFEIISIAYGKITALKISGTQGAYVPSTNPPLQLTLVAKFDTNYNSATVVEFQSANAVNVQTPTSTINDIRAILATIQSISDYDNLATTGDDAIAKEAIYKAFLKAGITNDPAQIRTTGINAYYSSIKHYLPNQWGEIHSYTIVDTGYYHKYDRTIGEYPTVFGGDTFINQFSLKRKLQLFNYTTHGKPQKADINYKKIGNLGYPMYWVSTEPENFNLEIQAEIDLILKKVNSSPGTGGSGSFWSKLWSIISGLFSGGAANVVPIMGAMIRIFTEIRKKLGDKNVNLDNMSIEGYIYRGIMYMYNYGVTTFFVESQVNVDYRQATNNTYGNYYPRVGTGIPDRWLQESIVPIIHDNMYTYNKSFSKQSRENYYSYLPEDYDPTKLCSHIYPNRAIWSDKTNLRETLNNWKIYRPVNNFDFPKQYGNLTALDGIQNKMVIARFENKSQIYNAVTTINTSGHQAYLGDDKLFSAPPLDFTETDSGSMGSQHKFLLKTEHGVVFTDAKRGQVILLRGTQPEVISDKSMTRWFNRKLNFEISKSFPNFDTDNNFNGVGLCGVYDDFYKRLIITKKDYKPKVTLQLIDGDFYYENTETNTFDKVSFNDPEMFEDMSWTISYNFLTDSWISEHSYLPDYYIHNTNYFQSGIDGKTYNHNTTLNDYTNFYGTQYPYILEYPFSYKQEDEILQSIQDYSSARIYQSKVSYTEPDEILYFNKAYINNGQQNSGLLNLIPKPKNNPYLYLKYPKYNADSKDIMLSKKDNIVSFNSFWDIVKDNNLPHLTDNKELIDTNLDYSQKPFQKAKIRAKNSKVRLILDNNNTFKLVSQFITQETQASKL